MPARVEQMVALHDLLVRVAQGSHQAETVMRIIWGKKKRRRIALEALDRAESATTRREANRAILDIPFRAIDDEDIYRRALAAKARARDLPDAIRSPDPARSETYGRRQ